MQVVARQGPPGPEGLDPASRRRRPSGPAGVRDVVNLLAFALRIQAAGINRRLKQDMVDQDPSIKREDLRNLCFFEPEITDEAMAAFEHYVNTKWPLRVYAIEPVIAQQNVADASSRRTQRALDLVGSGPAGPSGRSPDSRPTDAPPRMRRPSA